MPLQAKTCWRARRSIGLGRSRGGRKPLHVFEESACTFGTERCTLWLPGLQLPAKGAIFTTPRGNNILRPRPPAVEKPLLGHPIESPTRARTAYSIGDITAAPLPQTPAKRAISGATSLE